MSAPDRQPGGCIYALRLQADAQDASALRGRLEHVVSGRCHDFNSGAQLLACLGRDMAFKDAAGAPPSRTGTRHCSPSRGLTTAAPCSPPTPQEPV